MTSKRKPNYSGDTYRVHQNEILKLLNIPEVTRCTGSVTFEKDESMVVIRVDRWE